MVIGGSSRSASGRGGGAARISLTLASRLGVGSPLPTMAAVLGIEMRSMYLIILLDKMVELLASARGWLRSLDGVERSCDTLQHGKKAVPVPAMIYDDSLLSSTHFWEGRMRTSSDSCRAKSCRTPPLQGQFTHALRHWDQETVSLGLKLYFIIISDRRDITLVSLRNTTREC